MTLTVYTKPACKQCDLTKDLLDKAGIAYEVADITAPENLDKLVAFKDRGLMSAPIVDLGDATVYDASKRDNVSAWAGFRPDLIGELAA